MRPWAGLQVGGWAAGLRRQGLIGDLSVDTYKVAASWHGQDCGAFVGGRVIVDPDEVHGAHRGLGLGTRWCRLSVWRAGGVSGHACFSPSIRAVDLLRHASDRYRASDADRGHSTVVTAAPTGQGYGRAPV